MIKRNCKKYRVSFLEKLRRRISMNLFLSALNSLYRNYFKVQRKRFGYIDKTARVRFPILIKGIENVYIYEHSHILGNALIIATQAKFIMKKYSGSAEGLTVVTGNHYATMGEFKMMTAGYADVQVAKDVIVEEDVWLAANVTLLSGVIIGRGATIGAGSVVRNSVPPYAIVMGNPAKVIGFNFTPEEAVEHEKILYPENERIPIDKLKRNYSKYFENRIEKIADFIK